MCRAAGRSGRGTWPRPAQCAQAQMAAGRGTGPPGAGAGAGAGRTDRQAASATENDEQRRGEPHRAAFTEEAPVRQVPQVRAGSRPIGVPVRVDHEEDQGADHQHVQEGRQAEAHEALADERGGALAPQGPVGEVPGDEEEGPHEERLQVGLPEYERDLDEEGRVGPLLHIPASDVAVGHACVHVDHQHDHERPQLVHPRKADVPARGPRRQWVGHQRPRPTSPEEEVAAGETGRRRRAVRRPAT